MANQGLVLEARPVQLAAAIVILMVLTWSIADKCVSEHRTLERIVDALDGPRDSWTQEQRDHHDLMRTTEGAG